MTSHFVDLSKYRILDLVKTRLQQPTLQGVITRLTVAATYVDPSAPEIYDEAVGASLKFGGYLVTNPLYSAQAHVSNYMNQVKNYSTDYFDVVDVELTGGLSKVAITNHFVEVVDRLEQARGAKVVAAYSGKWFLDPNVDLSRPTLQRIPWWLASYPGGTSFAWADDNVKLMAIPTGINPATISAWQFSSSFGPVTLVDGRIYTCDGNLGLASTFLGDVTPPPPPPPTLPGAVKTLYSLYFRSGPGTANASVGGTDVGQSFYFTELRDVPSAFPGKTDTWARVTTPDSPVAAWLAVRLWVSSYSTQKYCEIL